MRNHDRLGELVNQVVQSDPHADEYLRFVVGLSRRLHSGRGEPAREIAVAVERWAARGLAVVSLTRLAQELSRRDRGRSSHVN
jgi:hypothetical protein